MAFDFSTVSVPFRMQPGLRRIAAGTAQLTPTGPASVHLAAKLAVLTSHVDQALMVCPGFDAAPALQALMRQASSEHPDAFDWAPEVGRFAAHRLGWTVENGRVAGNGPAAIGRCLQALPPGQRQLALFCLALEQDFALIDGATGLIPWLAVCLPSRWSPAAKLGRHFAEVHAPVADNRLLLAASDSLARLVTGTERWERFVWTITPQPQLDTHPARRAAEAWSTDASPAALASQAWFRSEHQTFIPLTAALKQTAGTGSSLEPASDLPTQARRQAVFTIRVEVRPLTVAVDSSERAARLHASLASMSDSVLAYRGLTEARERLLDWLAAVDP